MLFFLGVKDNELMLDKRARKLAYKVERPGLRYRRTHGFTHGGGDVKEQLWDS